VTTGSRTWLRRLTVGSLVIGVIALVITVEQVGVETLADHLAAIGPWFGLLLAIEAVATLCEAGAVYLMTRGPGAPNLRKVCVAQFAGRAVNSVTPAANIGEAIKLGLLARACSPRRIAAAILFVAFASLIVSLSLIAIGSLATALAFELPRAARIILVIAGALAGLGVVALATGLRRGVLEAAARTGHRLRLVSDARLARWRPAAAEIDARLRGELREDHRVAATGLVLVSQLLQRGIVWIAIVAAGYSLEPAQLVAVLSAGVVLAWISALVPLGIGVAEGGNAAIFALLGAPAALGVALALARRVNQIAFAALGFLVLLVDRLTRDVLALPTHRPSAAAQ
jgi:hypothetical protein